MKILAGTATPKLANTPAFIFFIPIGEGGSLPRNRLLLYYFESSFTATCKGPSK